ncbi:GNAT family N-acetyltransferase [Cryobacterium frigoriphilum]|uniref:GNAT family N-acetyltransferase n=1 Tax=Cryobacterium frigoriphilum TaxID=1259150 RepID=A0A4R8ZV04_9MICO|nr:GNAT family N-acetyltransferase [Cryobacterium frigoriphilum]TFD46970.1 GNAT family N-acetyltransferase [Cryobacterium frigoriphilum]
MSQSSSVTQCHTRRLGAGDLSLARITLNVMAKVFETDAVDDRDAHLVDLLRSPQFWAFTATIDGRVVGGLTGYTLPMARTAARELFIYDLAVDAAYQRRGVATRLMSAARQSAQVEGIDEIFLVAETADSHALAFYRAIGMAEMATTTFAYGSPA